MAITITRKEDKLIFDFDGNALILPLADTRDLLLQLLEPPVRDIREGASVTLTTDGSSYDPHDPEPLIVHLRDRVLLPYSQEEHCTDPVEGIIVQIEDENDEEGGLIQEANLKSPGVEIKVFCDNGFLVTESWATFAEDSSIQILTEGTPKV
jgi:hypothetical protein